MTLRSLFPHAPQTASISPHLPVIFRACKRNFNYKQFSPDMPTSKPNLQVSCNFSRWEQSRSTENSRPGGRGLRSREWVGREDSAKQMYSEKQRQEMTGQGSWWFYFLILLPSLIRLQPRVTFLKFLITTMPPLLSLFGLSVSYLRYQDS